jgi:hypothetical protein
MAKPRNQSPELNPDLSFSKAVNHVRVFQRNY